ncbi:helix-turn-helix transcriptional regulator [Citrobacter braakii]|jgi:AraC-like DNA-binding protein|uniref:helix-turn-helix transcriptional regulator n=1 Tax=Citrobacter meridianamericanus TaxID=2894201 RepID=UPI0012495E22|nr:helix-turn-helix transcriptional regulator [Citrobacter braakii]
MVNHENLFIKQVSTGIYDEKIRNLEISLPFCLLLYTKDKPFYISFDGVIHLITKDSAVFINKSIPFSVLLNWGRLENGLARTDIVSLKIPQQAISEYIRDYLQEDLLEAKKASMDDYVLINLNDKISEDFKIIDSLINSFHVTSTGDVIYDDVDKAKYMLILSLIQKTSPKLEGIILSCSSLTISEKVSNLVMSDYSKNWTSKEIAKTLNMSVSTLKKKMYQDVGAVNHFITKVKMIEALRQLRRTNLPINIIAMSLGYTSASYFTSVFKKHLNIFPSDVRKQDNNLD